MSDTPPIPAAVVNTANNPLLVMLATIFCAVVGYFTFASWKKSQAGAAVYKDLYSTAVDEDDEDGAGGNPTGYDFTVETEAKQDYERLRDSQEACPKQRICQALFRRAYFLIPLVNKIKADHEGLSIAKKKNLIGEDVWAAFKEAEASLEEEVLDLQAVASELLPANSEHNPAPQAWGERILQEAAREYWTHQQSPGVQEADARAQAIAQQQQARDSGQEHAAAPAAAPAPLEIPTPQGDKPAPPMTGEAAGYTWEQNEEEVEIKVPLPAGTTKKQVKVKFSKLTLSVTLEGAPAPIIDNRSLCCKVDVDGCTWTMEGKGEKAKVAITLEKADRNMQWHFLFNGDFDVMTGKDSPKVPPPLA
jgi:hypothetical protein